MDVHPRFRSTRGELSIIFHQSSFVAGDIVRGIVLARIYVPIIAESLWVKFLGAEKVKWTEKPTEKGVVPPAEQAQHPRFRQVIGLITTPQVLGIGEYTYPFTFEIPTALPGVFTMKTHSSDTIYKLGAMIRYSVEAVLDVPGEDEYPISSRDILVIHEKCLSKPRIRQDSTEKVVKFSMFNKGPCQVSASITRDIYYPGQTVHVKWEMSTPTGSALITVKELHTRLIQVLNVSLGFKEKRTFSRYITKTNSQGLPPTKSIVHYQPLPLASKSEGFVNPTTTTGSNLQCRYLLELECKLDGVSERIVMRLPIRIIGQGVECIGLVVTEPLSDDDGLAMALRSSSFKSR